jgi:long-chain acyl-CoA synthetase
VDALSEVASASPLSSRDEETEIPTGQGAWRNDGSRETEWNVLPAMWKQLAQKLPKEALALVDEHNGKDSGEGAVELTYSQLHDEICLFAWGLKALGVKKGQTLCLFSENSSRWLVADQGSSMLGGTNALRGITSPAEELNFIVENSKGRGLIVQNEATLEYLWPTLVASGNHKQLDFVICLWGSITKKEEFKRDSEDVPIMSYKEVIALGESNFSSYSSAETLGDVAEPTIDENDIYCIIYTSGTTGKPKGAMLSHKNLMYQMCNLHNVIKVSQTTKSISLLPPWHVYQLATSYYSYSHGITNRYSNVANFRNDLSDYGCDFVVAVPLVVENLYKRVMQTVKKMPSTRRKLVGFFLKASEHYIKATRVIQGTHVRYASEAPSFAKVLCCWFVHLLLKPIHFLANKLVYKKVRDQVNIKRTIVSGGGALSDYVEDFFEIIGVEIINGWGLTETSPVIAARSCANIDNKDANVRGTVGKPVPGTQIKAVNPETGLEVADGKVGLMLARGATVFQGYIQNPEATEKAFRFGEGWFDTGDLGYVIPQMSHHSMGGMNVLVGREKETIVLSNGENVEPSPIEQACLASPYIEQIMVVGQDKKHLGALVVPDYEALQADGIVSSEEEAKSEQGKCTIAQHLHQDVKRRVEARDFFKQQESVRKITLLPKPLTFEDGFLTRTMKVRRHIVQEHFSNEIESMFD